MTLARAKTPSIRDSTKPAGVLVVDRNRALSQALRDALHADEAYRVDFACGTEEARRLIRAGPTAYAVVLLVEDSPEGRRKSPAAVGPGLLEELSMLSPETEFVYLGCNSAVEALRAGAFMFLERSSTEPDAVAISVERATQIQRLKRLAERATAGGGSEPTIGSGEPPPRWDPASLLEAVEVATIAIGSSTDRTAHLKIIIEIAVALFRAKTAGVYRYDREREELTLIADSLLEQKAGRKLKLGEGLAGRLVAERLPFITVPDYDRWEHKSPAFDFGSFGAVLGVPVLWQGDVIGTLYLNDETGREYNEEDAEVLSLLARQVAVALVNAKHLAERQEKLTRLEKLSLATKQIMVDLTVSGLHARLTAIAEHATRILDAEACSVFLINEKGLLRLEASYGEKDGFQESFELRVRTGRKTGLTGHIAWEGRIFNAHGDELRSHPAVRGIPPGHLPSGACHSLLAIPLFRRVREAGQDRKGDLIGLLKLENRLGEDDCPHPDLYFIEEDEWILKIFADQVVEAIEIAALVARLRYETEFNQGRKRELELLQNAIEAIAEELEVERLLETVANGAADALEADFSLVCSYDCERGSFIRQRLASKSMPAELRRALQEEDILKGPIGESMLRQEVFQVEDILTARVPFLTEDTREGLVKAGVKSVQAVTLSAGEEPLGVLYVAYKEERTFGVHDRSRLTRFASYAALALKRARLFAEMTRAKRLAKAVSDVMVLGDAEETLQLVADATLAGVRCHLVTLYPYEASTQRLAGPAKFSGLGDPSILDEYDAGESDVLREVIGSGERVLVEDTGSDPRTMRSPFTERENVKSLVAVPLSAGGESMGVMFVSYRTHHRFTEEELSNIKLFSNQAAIAIQNARRHEMTVQHNVELEALQEAAKAISGALELAEVRRAIVDEALRLFSATSAILWPYDALREEFLLEGPAASGLSSADLDEAKAQQVEPGGLQSRILEEGWIGESDVESADLGYLSEGAREVMRRQEVRSLAGIRLQVGQEVLAVLSIGYSHRTGFSDAERRRLENFADYAALSLKRARLLDQARRTQFITEVVAKLSTTSEPPGALQAAVRIPASVTRCDEVRVYVRDPDSLEFTCYFQGPPTKRGKRDLQSRRVGSSKFLEAVLARDSHTFCDRTAVAEEVSCLEEAEPDFEAWVAVPMKVGDREVGVFFVAYDRARHFMTDELTSISMLANQTAIGIANTQHYEQAQGRARALSALYDAGHAIAESSLHLEATLKEIAVQALRIVGVEDDDKESFSYVALLEDSEFKLSAAHPEARHGILQRKLSEKGSEVSFENGITGRAIGEKKSLNVADVTKDPDYIALDRKTRSQLSVPVCVGNEVTALIGVERPMVGGISAEDKKNIELLAAQAGVAIQNARQHLELRRTLGVVGARTALAWMGMMAASWRHDIESKAVAIRGYAEFLLTHEMKNVSPAKRKATAETLSRIQRMAHEICQRPTAPALGSRDGDSSVRVNSSIRSWASRLWAEEEFQRVERVYRLELEEDATVAASPEWLRRAMGHVLRNAAQALARVRRPRIEIWTRRAQDEVLISVIDNGPGVPKPKLERLFLEPIKKNGDDSGLGYGLMLAQVIAQAYDGDIACAATDQHGTNMVFSFPLKG